MRVVVGKWIIEHAEPGADWRIQRGAEPAPRDGRTEQPLTWPDALAAILAGSPTLSEPCLGALDFLWRANVLTDREFEALAARVNDRPA